MDKTSCTVNWRFGRFVIVLHLLLILEIGRADAGIYLARNDTGSLVLTNTPEKHGVDKRFRLVTDTESESSLPVKDVKTLEEIVTGAARKHSLPKSLIYAVIDVESNGDTYATSSKGALGLMQLMPGTAEHLGVNDPLDPRQNIFGGSKYLDMMIAKFNGDLDKALAAYNAGPGNVEEHNGIPPYNETRRFVQRVRNRFERFRSRNDIIYTYRDENGLLHVTNIR